MIPVRPLVLLEEERRRERLAVERKLVVVLLDVRREEGERVEMGEKSQVSVLLAINRTGVSVSGRGPVVLVLMLLVVFDEEESFVLGREEEGFSRSVLGLMVERASEVAVPVEEDRERRLSLVWLS